jgi:hypothetical protein
VKLNHHSPISSIMGNGLYVVEDCGISVQVQQLNVGHRFLQRMQKKGSKNEKCTKIHLCAVSSIQTAGFLCQLIGPAFPFSFLFARRERADDVTLG